MKKLVRKLRLRQGDILVVNNMETARALVRSRPEPPRGVTSIPIVVAPEGIKAVPLEKLKKLIAELDKEIR
jgi:hypothetical protein